MCVFPYAEDGERPIDSDRYQRENQPETRQRLDLGYISPQRIRREAEQQAEIHAETSRTDAELLTLDVKRPLRYLMADKAKEMIER